MVAYLGNGPIISASVVVPHTLHERGNVIGVGVHIYI